MSSQHLIVRTEKSGPKSQTVKSEKSGPKSHDGIVRAGSSVRLKSAKSGPNSQDLLIVRTEKSGPKSQDQKVRTVKSEKSGPKSQGSFLGANANGLRPRSSPTHYRRLNLTPPQVT